MSLHPLTFQLNPLVCLHLLFLLLLLTESSSSRASGNVTAPVDPLTQLNTTQANCSTACDNGENTKKSPESTGAEIFPRPKSLSPMSDNNSQVSSVNRDPSSPSSSHTSVSHKLNDTAALLIPPDQSTSLSANQQPVPPEHQPSLPETVIQPADLLPSNITEVTNSTTIMSVTTPTMPSSTTTATPTSTVTTTPMSTATTTKTSTTTTATKLSTTTPLPTTTTTTTATATATATATTTTTTTTTTATTTVKATTTISSANKTVRISTTTNMTPPSSTTAMPLPNTPITGMPPIHTITVTSAITPANHNKPVALGTRVAMVEVAGGALTRQLVDTASLLAVLLFGLLFFLVTVAVFVTQAYESYRRKDYTQVDYLINGMYTDTGV